MSWPILSVAVQTERDVVAARRRAREIAGLLDLDPQDGVRVATAVSEIVRNAYAYAGGGRVEFELDDAATPQLMVVRVLDRGPGVADLDAILEGRYRSTTGMGLGVVGARRLMDHFRIEGRPEGGTMVELGKARSRRATHLTRRALGERLRQLDRSAAPDEPLAALEEQNRDLMLSLAQLQDRQQELSRLNAELEDTNRGVVALYAELEDAAEQVRRASESKTRFLSNMTHEFRTPLNSILALSRLLSDQVDGALTEEQLRQVEFIRSSAASLSGLVDDLLDLAKVEAGKLDVRPVTFTVEELFGALRGALKPLLTGEAVELVFEETAVAGPLFTDEGKLAQVLRNFISNALKFTAAGEVRVSASPGPGPGQVTFRVRDTGVGVAPEHQEAIFQEFTQVPNALQGRAKGTGLGLSLSRRLAELLGGRVGVESTLAKGSTFWIAVPMRLDHAAAAPGQGAVAVIDDDETFRYLLRRMIDDGRRPILEAADGVEGLALVRRERPALVFLDLQMPGADGYAVLAELQRDPDTRGVPVVVCTSSDVSGARSKLGAAHVILDKCNLQREVVQAVVASILDPPVPAEAQRA